MILPTRFSGRHASTRLLLLSLLLLGTSCASARRGTVEATAFAPALSIDLARMQQTEEGLFYEELERGSGARAERGRRVAVHYVGWLSNGTEIDALIAPQPPIVFRVGAGEVIRGWEIGVQGMREGGQRRIVVPSELGYGSRAVGPIPRRAVLVFTLHLVAVD